MRPRRYRPPWSRMLLEFVAMLAVYLAVLLITRGEVIIALIAMIVTMFVLRATRSKPGEPPPPGRP